jgi:hypothetical protein
MSNTPFTLERKIRFVTARALIHFGLFIMPSGPYKTMILLRLWELKNEVEQMIKEAKEAKNGNQ